MPNQVGAGCRRPAAPTTRRPLRRLPLWRLLLWPALTLALTLLPAGCVAPGTAPGAETGAAGRDPLLTWLDLRPVSALQPIGLLAPFEGLERRQGYDALDALRRAIADSPPTAALLPLALDSSRDPTRAAQKLLLDPNLAAVLGPLAPHALPAPADAAALHALGAGRWLAPFALTPAGWAAPDDPAWLQALISGAAEAAAGQGATQLLLATGESGATASFAALLTQAQREGIAAPIPIVWEGDPASPALELPPGSALLWLGNGAVAAERAAALRLAGQPNALWLAPWAADALFFEHLGAALADAPDAATGAAASDAWQGLYTLAWQDAGFDTWAAERPGAAPERYAQEVAAAQLAATVANVAAADPSAGAAAWRLVAWQLTAQGERLPLGD